MALLRKMFIRVWYFETLGGAKLWQLTLNTIVAFLVNNVISYISVCTFSSVTILLLNNCSALCFEGCFQRLMKNYQRGKQRALHQISSLL